MKLILIGDSGHGKVIAESALSAGYTVVAKLDDKYGELVREEGMWIGPISEVNNLIEKEQAKVILSIGSNKTRKQVIERMALKIEDYATVIHEKAVISPSAVIGRGAVIMAGVVINAEAVVGDHAIVNTGAVIEHDCIVGDYAHLSPGSILTGGVTVGEGTQVGAGATVIPLKKIGQWSVIGAGAVVLEDIEGYSTAVGVPAKTIKRIET